MGRRRSFAVCSIATTYGSWSSAISSDRNTPTRWPPASRACCRSRFGRVVSRSTAPADVRARYISYGFWRDPRLYSAVRLGGATMVQVGPRAATSAAPASPHAPPPGEQATPAAVEDRPLTRRRYSVEIPIDPEYLPFIGLMFIGLVLRFWDLGFKALHHDESLHAFYAWRLFDGQGYIHDPMMHGPLLFELNALVYLLFGASDFTARLVPALFGVALIGMPFLLRHELGRAGAIAASLLFVFSPAFLYFSRFIRHDIYVDFFTLLLVVGVFRYLAGGNKTWFYTACVSAALLFATKEDFYISGFIPFLFLGACWFLLKGDRRLLYRSRIKALGWNAWATGFLVFLVINIVLYTTFLTNMRGICTALVTLPLD